MRDKQIFDGLLEIVIKETEMERERLFSLSRDAEVTDARYMFVKLLVDYGYYNREIADYTGFDRRSVADMAHAFDVRMGKGGRLFADNFARIKRRFEAMILKLKQ